MFYRECYKEWYQGDIVSSFPFISTDLKNTSLAATKLFDKPGMIVTQTCDLQRKPFVQICPIHDFGHLKQVLTEAGKSEQGADSFIDSVRRRSKDVYYYFYIQQDDELGINEGYADLNFISTIPRNQIEDLERVATLADYPRHVLAFQLGNLFMRPH